MTSHRGLTSKKMKRLTILHFWNNGERFPTKISRITKIPLGTVKYNISKIKQQGTTEDRSRSGRPRTRITKHLVNEFDEITRQQRRNWWRNCFKMVMWMYPGGQYNVSSKDYVIKVVYLIKHRC